MRTFETVNVQVKNHTTKITVWDDQPNWPEMFRPSSVAEIALPAEVKKDFDKYVEEQRFPSLLFNSPQPGTGKTTSALCLCRDCDIEPLLINASKDTNIEVIRTKVSEFATRATAWGNKTRVVILDECERLSPAAQEALKGIVEQVSRNCVFILTTNAKSRINEALASRCVHYDFVWGEDDQKQVMIHMMKRLSAILSYMKKEFDPAVLAKLVTRYAPDNRSIIHELQRYALTHDKIDAGILSRNCNRSYLDTLVTAFKSKQYKSVMDWVTNNQSLISGGIYEDLMVYLTAPDSNGLTRVNAESIPVIITILAQEQKFHTSVQSIPLHIKGMLTQLCFEDIKYV